ncbi:MAG: PD-(D/E)XK nuclease family protein [Pirellulales bacterium]
MPARVHVVTGPARCGKTEQLLNRYRKELARFSPGSTLWLAPTQRSAVAVRGRLLSKDLPACLDPGVMTFDQFATAVLSSSPTAARRIDSVQQRELFRRLVDEAASQGKLRHFQPIAHTAGLIDLLVQFVRELKRLEIWPDEFRTACEKVGSGHKDQELWALYAAYQEILTQHNLFDAEGRFWSARALLRQQQPARFARLELVVVDGFTDFTRTQHEMLEILAGRVDELLISLPLEPTPVRQELFAKTLATLARLEHRHPQLAVEAFRRPATSDWPIISHLEAELFQNPRQFRQPPTVERIVILAAASTLGEIETLARRIKQLLIEGNPDTGDKVRPGDIAVVFRSPRDYVALVREVFDRFGLPTSIEIGRRLDESKAIASLVALVRLHVEDWPFRQLLAVLRNNFFRPNWPDSGRLAIDAAEQVIRELQVPQGRKVLLDRIHRWARLDQAGNELPDTIPITDPRWPETLERRRQRAKLALPLLQGLAQAMSVLDDAPSSGGKAAPEFQQAMEGLAKETGLRRAVFADEEKFPLVAQERAAWTRLLLALGGCQTLAEYLGEQPARLKLEDWFEFLQDVARSQQLPGGHDETGQIRVLTAGSARTLDIPYLFFAGLSEKSFPPAARDDGLYSEAETRRLTQQGGLPLVLRAERNQEEMLLFYEVLSRVSRRLFLSYPALDSKAQALLPSPYLQEIERVCGSGKIPVERAADLSPLPPPGDPLCAADFRLLAVSRGMVGDDGLLAAHQLAAPAASSQTAPAALTAGLLLTAERSHWQSFGPYEGLFTSSAARDKLARKYGPDRLWSASHLETYAACPFKFFMEHVLRLQPLDEIGLETDYMSRGGLLHDVLADLHRRLNAARGNRPTVPSDLSEQEFVQHYDAALAAIMALPDNEDALAGAMREIDQRMVRLWTQAYRGQHEGYSQLWQGYDTPPRPAHFEVSFGTTPPAADPLSSTEPLVLQCGEEMVRLSGRIDRLDVGRVAGQNVFNVLDYKSGKTRDKLGSEVDGRALQLELYSLAAQQVLLAGENAVPWHAGYWHVQLEGFKTWLGFHESEDHHVRPTPLWQDRHQKLLNRLREMVQGIRHGDFPVHSLDEHCTGYCSFSTVCRVNQVRSLEKTWPTPPQQPA